MKHIVLTLFIVPFLLGTTIFTKKADDVNPKIVVLELFTSQGCSSCPPADELLKKVKSDNVIALSYHVDYWNYIGWKDPFSQAFFTEKQRQYASKFYSSSIYTPQVVVNGKEHFVGSSATKMKHKISEYSKGKASEKITISNSKLKDDFVTFDYNFEGNTDHKNLRIVLVIDERKTNVKRGENRNKVLVNNNIVVAEQNFKLDKASGKGSIQVPKIVDDMDNLSIVLIVENDKLDILTATQISL